MIRLLLLLGLPVLVWGQAPLAPRLHRAMSLPMEELRQLQAEVAQVDTGDVPLALATVRRALTLDPEHPLAKSVEAQLLKMEKAR